MDIETLDEFVTLVRFANFSQAARHLHISQPTLSKHVSSLETQLKCMLIKRDSRNFTVTEQGLRLYEGSLEILNTYTKTLNEIRSARSHSSVVIAGVIASPAVSQLTMQIAEADEKLFPSVFTGQSHPVMDLLEGKHVDVFFLPMAESRVAIMSSETEFVPVSDDPLVAVVPRTSKLWGQTSVALSELRDLTFIHMSDGFNTESGWESIREMCLAESFEPRSRIAFPNSPLMLTSDEVLILPRKEADGTVMRYGTKAITAIPLQDKIAHLTTYLIARREDRSTATDKFVNNAKKMLRQD